MSTIGRSRSPVKDRLCTRQKLSIKSCLAVKSRSSIFCSMKLAQQIGTAVPGPFVTIKFGLSRTISRNEWTMAHKVVKTLDE